MPASPGTCPKGPALSLNLEFKNKSDADKWLDLEMFSKGPCDVAAFPKPQSFVLRLSYPQKSFKSLGVISYETQTGLVVDHWYEGQNSQTKRKARVKTNSKSKARDALNPLLKMNETLQGVFEDQESWAKILGKQGSAYSFDSPELDRFRTKQLADFDRFNREDLIKVPLKVPLLTLPYLDAQLNFEKQEIEIKDFEENSLAADEERKYSERDKATALKGLNYFAELVRKKEWVAANESIRILESSKFQGLLPRSQALWWALKGFVTIELGKKTEDKLIMLRGFDYWRDGLRKTAGRGGMELAYSDYMLLESLRNLFLENEFYAAAATLAWVQKYRWSPETEERIAFLRAEVHYRLGLMDESHLLFEEFIESRKKLPVSAAYDRRLLPVAFFRLGDIRLRQKRYEESVNFYTKALNNMPSLNKVNFEGSWYPSELRFYPQALYHRAEAYLRIGKEQAALGDLRAFAHFSLDHPNSDLVLFRIGDILESLGAEPSKIDGTWRECVFRSSEGVGSRLCAARQAVRSMLSGDPQKWPRFAAVVEDVVNAKNLEKFPAEFKEDLKIYIRIILADALLKRDSPYQAFEQLERAKTSSGDSKLKAWALEYQLSALAGHLSKRIEIGRYREAIKAFSDAKKRRKLDVLRPEVQWPLIEAYRKLGITSLATEQLDLAWPYVDSKMPHASRPYLPSLMDWAGMRLELLTDVYKDDKNRAKDVASALKNFEKAGASPRQAIRAKIKIKSIEEKPKDEIELWNKLQKIDVFSWEDIAGYATLLNSTKKYKDELNLLERNVGAWLKVREADRPQPAPSVMLIFSLFEARERAEEWGPAYAALNFLKSMDEKNYGEALTRAQIFYREGNLNKEMGRKTDARQSFESAKSMAPDSVWARLSEGELGTL